MSDGYLRPVQFSGMSTWTDHRHRTIPSIEPGTDYYCPIGTPVFAAADGVVVDVGDSIGPATGKYVAVDLDDGRRIRYLHLTDRFVSVGDRVSRGRHIADSGATGYGKQDWSDDPSTGGAHVHTTLWAAQHYVFGRDATLDPELFMTGTPGGVAGRGSQGFLMSPPTEWDEMASKEEVEAAAEAAAERAIRRVFVEQLQRINDRGGSYSVVTIRDPDGIERIYVGSQLTGRTTRVLTPYHLRLLQRYKMTVFGEVMLEREVAIVQSYLQIINEEMLKAPDVAAAIANVEANREPSDIAGEVFVDELPMGEGPLWGEPIA